MSILKYIMSIFIDCGTNFKQGLHEIQSLHTDIQKTYSFEANTYVYDLLDKNDGNIYFNLAVSDKTGFATFHAERCIGMIQGDILHGEDRFIGGGSRLQEPKHGVSTHFDSNKNQTIGGNKQTNNIDEFIDDMYEKITIPTIRLVDFIKYLNLENNSIILKLDVEGEEYAILKDMKESNIFNKIKILHVEWHDWARMPEYDNALTWVNYFTENKIEFTSRGIV